VCLHGWCRRGSRLGGCFAGLTESILSPLTVKSHCKPPLLRPWICRFNAVIHLLYSSCNHVASFFLFLAQKMPHLTSQNSSTYTLVVDIFRIAFIMCMYKCVQCDKFLPKKGGKMARDEPSRLGTESYREIRMSAEVPKSKFIPKPLGKYCWHGILMCPLRML
jgi:hypothetical protein